MKIWYARVSSRGQSLETQTEKLEAAWCEKVFEETKSGASKTDRQKLAAALGFIREGDQFVVTRLDRLARSVLDLTQTAREISGKNVDLIVLDQSIDTRSPTGRLLFHVLASIWEFERELIKERAAEGIARAKASWVRFGAKRKLSEEKIAALKKEFNAGGESRTAIARRYGVSRATAYRLVKPTGR